MSEGERVIRGTRRPDGTYRKDVKVRAGYTPQDEQPVYVPRGAQALMGAPKVPGLYEDDLDSAKAAARSRAAKKNAARKAKKVAEGEAAPSVASLTNGFAKTRIDDEERSAAPSSAGAGGAEAAEGTISTAEKQLRAIQKKLRQCEALQEREAKGESMTGPEREKLSKMPGWSKEADELRAIIASE
ncbi:g2194 [Coccomyxa viridis]|uniref:G2194 protein n=1 Tax=Coccomyxa viridis TaxID=1274662 RepID=A0ABP1FJS5_9CHLO